MSQTRRVHLALLAAIAILRTSGLLAQPPAGLKPTNDAPNPFRTDTGWAKMPEGRTWGSTSAVEIDKDGVSIWVAERCGANVCRDSTVNSILHFDASGKLIKSFGAGMLMFPHGIFVDRDGNVWVTDGQDNLPRRGRGQAADAPLPPPPAKVIGHNVYKFSPDGKLLLTLGKPGGAREPEFFWQPNDVLVAPNGEIYVAEGHSSNAANGTPNARILKFSKDGKLIASWGQFGQGPDDYDQPHALAMDSKGRLFVGDRGNNRIKILDQSGKLLDTWYQFSRPSGIYIDKDDNIYVADSESGSVNPAHVDWKRGIRMGSAKDGSVKSFIPDPNEAARGTSAAEGVAVDSKGNVYGAEVGPPGALKRYIKKS